MLKLRISLLILVMAFMSIYSLAQEASDYAYKLDSTINKWAPTGIRVGMDVVGPVYNIFDQTKSSYEIAADVDFHKFFAVVEAGQGSYRTNEIATNYSSKGMFFRAGLDANFISKDPNLNVFFFGLRYATSSFDEKMSGDLPSTGWGTQTISLEQNNSRANWVEMNIGMRVRIWRSIFAGYTGRLKILKHNTYNEAQFQSYYIPGYGQAERTTNWGFNYYVQYRFSWKKKPIPWRENK